MCETPADSRSRREAQNFKFPPPPPAAASFGRGGFGFLPVEGDDLAVFDGERKAAAFQLDRLFAENQAPPAAQRGDIRLVVGGDRLEVVDGGDHLGGDAGLLGDLPQQNLEQFDGRAIVVATVPLDGGQGGRVAREAVTSIKTARSRGLRARWRRRPQATSGCRI